MAFLFLVLSLSISCYGVSAENNNIPEMHHSFTRSQEAMDSDFDCVDIYKQPAFQHPLLKNHKIQLKPTYSRDKMQSRSSYIPNAFKTHNFRTTRCPPGSVPIHRIKMRQQINNTSSKSQSEDYHQYSPSFPGHHFATLDTNQNMTSHGASAIISIFNLSLQVNQYSMSQIWLQSGPPTELNIIKVGLGVYPSFYRDMQTRLTAFWTADNFQNTGCINTECIGFVLVDRDVFLGASTARQSVIGSDEQYSITFRVKQDQSTGHWWLRINSGDGDKDIGYWPKEIFTHLNRGASLIRFGGETFTFSNMPSPPMGSGMLPSTHDFKSSAYMSALQIVDSSYNQHDVIHDAMKPYCDTSSNCYDVLLIGLPEYKQAVLFGGPGGQCGVVKAAEGRVPVFMDGGVRRGTDVFNALALGASGVFIGRPVVFSLAADGEAGVRKVLEMLRDEFEITMALCGCRSNKEITCDHVVTEWDRPRIAPRL